MTIDKLLFLGFSFLIYKRAMIIKILVIRVLVWIKCLMDLLDRTRCLLALRA